MSVMVHSGGGSGDSDLLEGGDGVWPPASPFPLPFTTGFGLRHPRGAPAGALKSRPVVLAHNIFLYYAIPYASKLATVCHSTKKDDARWASSGLLLSGKRGSNPRPSAWEADALPTELFPLMVLQI